MVKIKTKLMTGFTLSVIIILFFTTFITYAERSFEITDYQAQIKILENGDIQVSEIFEYSFNGDFNGIIRTIGIKGSDGFKYFKASEYFPEDKELEYTQSLDADMVTYKIYDKSSNERKSFLLKYQLKNVAVLYNDTAEFYWGFFDESNTTPIGHIKIEIELPVAEVSAEELKVFGYGPLDGKVSIRKDGKIVYEVFGLSSGEMVEARILFPTSLIPNSTKIINQNKFAEIMKEELEWAKQTERTPTLESLVKDWESQIKKPKAIPETETEKPGTKGEGEGGGKIAFVSSTRDGIEELSIEIYVMNADGSNQTRITNNPAIDSTPCFSPDGTKIAFTSWRDGNPKIYVMNADGSDQTRLTNNLAVDELTFWWIFCLSPCFSPDGTKIAFTSWRDGNPEIYVMNADGSNQTRITNNPADDMAPCFSPEGTKIAFMSWRDGNPEIYVMNADGSNQTNITNNPAGDGLPCFSPDGTKIAFTSTGRDGEYGQYVQIYVMNADGSNQTRLTNAPGTDWLPCFSPDGTKIAFTSERDAEYEHEYEIYVMNADGSDQTNITNNPGWDMAPSWGP